ncbi:hypothetical protein BDY21DRAFT_330508 [Lineolata rhizophorae]|uniref:Uncharacterized protein n=1 Tax=Lineolata rhizophorae TaxID=578093 RepID=A0A6A6PE69_9PEZI|nr:hypothetical protein BDY21DRAFT_330508 [Lineolata rhizophorae]
MTSNQTSPSNTSTSTTTSQAPSTTFPKTQQPADPDDKLATARNNIALGCLFLCPAIALLPPRKLDFYTFSLGAIWVVSANHTLQIRTGRGILDMYAYRSQQRQEARMLQQSAALERRLADHRREEGSAGNKGFGHMPTQHGRELHEHFLEQRLAKARAEGDEDKVRRLENELLQGKDERGFLSKLWYGDESKLDWKAKRMEEERKALEEGKGYGDLIMEQVKEVWKGKSDENQNSKK